MDKIGDKVMLLELPDDEDSPQDSFFGHYIGDIGTIIDILGNSIVVNVKGRISQSSHTPYVCWYRGTYKNITRSLKIDSLVDE